MIHITGKIPRQVAIAVSGGIDSMAVLDFLRRSRDVVVLHLQPRHTLCSRGRGACSCVLYAAQTNSRHWKV